MGDLLQLFQHCLNVREVVDQIRKQDVIEFFLSGKFKGIGNLELKAGVAAAGELNHFRAEVDAHAPGGSKRGEQIAQAAADLKHAQTGRDEKSEMVSEKPLVIAIGFPRTERSPLVIKS